MIIPHSSKNALSGAKNKPSVSQSNRYVRALSPFIDESPERLIALGKIVDCFRLYQVRHLNNPEAIAYTEARLRDDLGRNWKQWCGHLLFTEGGYRFGVKNSYTRELTVRADVVQAFDVEYTRQIARQDYRRIVAMKHGRRKAVNTQLPPLIQVNVYNIELAETIYSDWLDAIDDSSIPELAVDSYVELYERLRNKPVHASKSFDEFAPVWRRAVLLRRDECINVLDRLQGDQLPQRYEQRNGKPRYQMMGIGMQNCHKVLRYSAMGGQWSYDIRACHHFIMQHYARLGGIECPSLDLMVKDKDRFRKSISQQTDIPIDDVKTALLIKSYGGRFGWADVYDDDKECALLELLGKKAQRRLSENETFKSLSRETHQITTFIIDHHKPVHGARGGVKNALGQMLRPTDKKPLKRSQIAAFILQGIEAKAALAMIDASKSPRVLIHDGIVCQKPENLAALEDAMMTATGIRLRLDEKQIKPPKW